VWLVIGTQIVCKSQSDSVTITSELFDTLAFRNVRCQYLTIDNIALKNQLSEQISINTTTSIQLREVREMANIDALIFQTKDKQIKVLNRKVAGLKIGCVSIGILGLIGTGYFLIN